MNRRAIASLVGTWMLLAPSFLMGRTLTELPLDILPDGGAVAVFVNGEGPFQFLVSTDSEYTFIGDTTAAKMALTQAKSGETETIHIRELKLGDEVITNLDARIIPSQFISRGDAGPHGILGWGILKSYLWTVDFPRQKLLLERGRLNATTGKNIIALQQHSAAEAESGKALTIPVQLGDLSFQAEMNSGNSTGLALPEEFAERVPTQEAPGVIGFARTPDGNFPLKGATIDANLLIGTQAVQTPPARFSGLYQHPSLGYEVLRKFSITFDHQQNLVRLVRPQGVTDPQQARAAVVPELGTDATLQAEFNKDKGKVRLLMILSPT